VGQASSLSVRDDRQACPGLRSGDAGPTSNPLNEGDCHELRPRNGRLTLRVTVGSHPTTLAY